MWYNRLNHQKTFHRASEHPYRLGEAVRFYAPTDLGEGYEDGFSFDNSLLLTIKQVRIKNAHRDHEEGLGRLVFMLHLGGCRIVELPDLSTFQLSAPSFIAYFHPAGALKINDWFEGSSYTCVSVSFDVNDPPDVVRGCVPSMLDAIHSARRGTNGFCWFEQPLCPTMQVAAAQLIAPTVHEHLVAGFLSAKSTEMLCLGADALLRHKAQGRLEDPGERKAHLTKEFLDHHASEKISAKDLSVKMGVSGIKLSRTFRDEFGCSITDYRTNIRMMKAAEMLASTNIPMKQIAFEVGYNHTSNFSIAFKRRFGMTPGQVRARGRTLRRDD